MEGIKIGFVGGGVMASALIAGILKAELVPPSSIIVAEPFQASRERLATQYGVLTTTDNIEVCRFADFILICVKPDVVRLVLVQLNSEIVDDLPQKCFISIAAGIPIQAMQSYIPSAKSIIRVMPNTPCSVSESAAAYATGSGTSVEDKKVCEKIFGAVGTCSEVDEKLMDAVTGLSGSGPAYVFMFIEALADGGVRMGLPRHVAMQLAAQTVKGAAAMCLETGLHPGQLKDQVCSPGGTTIAGVQALEDHGFRAATMSAVVAASQRSIELRDLSKK